jgi:peptidoglycan/LPS O-acetylase OafA/YrhL
MPELDVLRGCAILAVLFYHGLYWSGVTSQYRLVNLFIKTTVIGWLGVNLFFVLSGFLITGILMDTKGSPAFYRRFYLRRALRILPVYLVMIVFLFLLGQMSAGSASLSLVFLSNYDYLFHVGAGYGPLWSLSVEEQFYLVWPAVVGRVSTRVLLVVSVALCLIEPFLRWLDVSGHLALGSAHTSTVLIADNLALGALAAIFARSRYGTLSNAIWLGLGLCGAGLAVLAAGLPFGIMHRTNPIGNTFQQVPWNLVFTGVLLISLGLRSPLASSIWAAPLRFYGYISYGLYLIHVAVFNQYDVCLLHLSNPALRQFLQAPLPRFFLVVAICTLITWLSRTFYEERFLRMGRAKRPAAAASMAPLAAMGETLPASTPAPPAASA